MNFSERLQKLRNDLNMTQSDLAEKLDIKQQAVSSYEKGTSNPKIDIIVKISKIFDVSIEYLIGATEVPYSKEMPDDVKELLKTYYSLPNDKKKLSIKLLGVLKDTSEKEV